MWCNTRAQLHESLFRLGSFVGTRAFEHYCAWVVEPSPSFSDLPARPFASSSRPALLDLEAPVHGCFAALFQGDASGVELATAAHASFLEQEGVLPPAEHGRILAQHALSREGPWTGVAIDDFFCLSTELLCRPPGTTTDSERVVRRAKRGYAREGIRGSDDKDIFGAEVFTVAGAECDSSPSSVKEGLVSVAAPAQKRLALSLVSLRAAASMRWISEELAAQLSGGWVAALMFRRCAMALANEIFSLGTSQFTSDAGSRLLES